MRPLVLLALCLIAAAAAAPPNTKGIIINLDNGELCALGVQCKSSCCHRKSFTSLARCKPLSAENQKCTPKGLDGTYYECPCENGLKCVQDDWSIGGAITNTNFGICKDPNALASPGN